MSMLAPLAPVAAAVLLASGGPAHFQPVPSVPLTPAARTVSVVADRDATLFEETNGQLASGSGDGLFVGKTAQSVGALRRVLVHFTPPEIPGWGQGRGVLENAVLVLHASPTLPSQPDPRELRVHEVLADWGEGVSVSPAGTGVTAEAGDATWVHTSFSFDPAAAIYWLHNGGQFGGQPLASAARQPDGSWRFSSPELTALVARWVGEPETNFGLIVLGNETLPQTAKTLASREHADASVRPTLELTVRPGVRDLGPAPARPTRARSGRSELGAR